ncbi:MAG: HlyD family secretion protein [Proteobacteria bacterium]|nr:HlyD family secretion protein [Pseudomonadota bacterium]
MDQTVSTPRSKAEQSPASAPPSIGRPVREGRSFGGLRPFLLRPRILAALVVVLLAVAYGGREVYLRFTHVYEYDARVTADIVTVSSRADGWVVELPALEGMKVAANDVIVRIDDRVAKLRADALSTQLQGIQAERQRLMAERRMVKDQTEAVEQTRASAVTVKEKALAALRADLELARLELERNKSLFDRRVANERQLQVAQASATKLESQLQQAQAEYEQAQGSLREAVADRERLGVIDAQIDALAFQATNLQAQLSQQQVDVQDRTIRSPVPAVIDRTFVQPGEYVQAGQRILMLHNAGEVWIEANIKETQVGQLKVGQKVLVAVDAYPSERFVGHVLLIGSATTARFALLPTPNPSGNFTKITQRVPVRVKLDRMPKPLSPGMMVEVEIELR